MEYNPVEFDGNKIAWKGELLSDTNIEVIEKLKF